MVANPPQIFIAHASEDKPQVRELYIKLLKAGYKPWLDEEDLIPGQNWREEIPKALKSSDLFIACLSSTSISKRGYIQREFKMAMKMLDELPPGEIYLIPLKFDDCQIPEIRQSDYGLNLQDIQWLDYWQPNGFEKLIKAIEYQFGTQEKDSEKRISTPNIAQEKTSINYSDPEAVKDWQEKLAMFRKEEVIITDPEKKFVLRKRIQECIDKIEELGG
ncbi:toll/interleukin-1 receptor domain-containing protein [Crocosphaera sp.]|uniref:toll/interleukin-1 receptor domain-containing protein n=1 Tax=Crocosphaera sp. TaxID=2729996 RepID=UPI00262368C4|nr:toll/interleukin-1 receptor domain-containing protein [Crocosphaera sp.]MDJ0583217.1 toll/interleukin-1 receptor domain-containing protein [Crocosphaera sp.]